jgi:hypothetical protein
VTQEDQDQHIRHKVHARFEMEKDVRIKFDGVKVLNKDLQALLQLPRSNAAKLYFRSKLKLHNGTIINTQTDPIEVDCYMWGEVGGGLGSNIFTTILINHILKFIAYNPDVRILILWSDGCGYQNKNSTLA